MTEFDYSNTILIVKPIEPNAIASLRSDHNTNRLMSFHFEDDVSSVSGYDDSRSREYTPYVSRPSELQLHLQFDTKPKDATQGFVFGTKEKNCNVQLLKNPDPNKKKRYGISKQHFRIDFNWKSGFLRLNNMSPTNDTGMSAPSVKNGFQSLKYNNMHMLHPAEQTKVWVDTLIFEVSFPTRGQYQRHYERNWEVYRRKHGDDVPNMNSLDIQSTLEITPFVQHRQGRRNAYLLHGEIGTGQFGMVCKANDSRTGGLFAAKQFVTRKPGWDAKAYLEIAISQDVTHEHIVSFVDFIDDGGGPILVMERRMVGKSEDLNYSHQLRRFILSQMPCDTNLDEPFIEIEDQLQQAHLEAHRLENEIRDYLQLQIGELALQESRKSIELSGSQIEEAKRG
ncbi:MAG: hypothetical protein ASARMPRED_005971 [Alectoria sarmentosa]|nr:MAG: hypothetical protein ASARMPRED_005971 [Alectoria sarmentosa]